MIKKEKNWPNCDKLPNYIQFQKCDPIPWKDVKILIPFYLYAIK